jgi:hypothetical protein
MHYGGSTIIFNAYSIKIDGKKKCWQTLATVFQFGLKPALARPGDHRAASSNGGKKGLHRRELPLSILQSKLAATQQRAPDALPGLALSLLATRGKDLALGMATFFEIPWWMTLDRAHGLILDAIGAPALSLCNKFVLNRPL